MGKIYLNRSNIKQNNWSFFKKIPFSFLLFYATLLQFIFFKPNSTVRCQFNCILFFLSLNSITASFCCWYSQQKTKKIFFFEFGNFFQNYFSRSSNFFLLSFTMKNYFKTVFFYVRHLKLTFSHFLRFSIHVTSPKTPSKDALIEQLSKATKETFPLSDAFLTPKTTTTLATTLATILTTVNGTAQLTTVSEVGKAQYDATQEITSTTPDRQTVTTAATVPTPNPEHTAASISTPGITRTKQTVTAATVEDTTSAVFTTTTVEKTTTAAATTATTTTTTTTEPSTVVTQPRTTATTTTTMFEPSTTTAELLTTQQLRTTTQQLPVTTGQSKRPNEPPKKSIEQSTATTSATTAGIPVVTKDSKTQKSLPPPERFVECCYAPAMQR